ncbi:ComEC/Rec2 family competence protein, partial [Candidatus Woesebacteria bacterium]|nr:ComEC/Rec2 family competence protein [Candidatus Woesebacteria bacterium]
MRFLFWFLLITTALVRVVFSRPHYKDGQILRIRTYINTEPSYSLTNQKINVEGIVVIIPKGLPVRYGDFIMLEGEIRGGTILKPKILKITPPKGLLFNIRNKILKFYTQTLPQKEASLISGIVLGSKENLSFDFWNRLKNSGTAHVVVASGTNVTFIASYLVSFLTIFFKRRKLIFIVLAGIWIYCVFAGMDTPIIRAGLMASIVFTSQILGRVVSFWRVLLLVFLGMLSWQPLWIFDLGFILSFASCAALVVFSKPIGSRLKIFPGIIRESLSVSMAATIGVSPILYFIFGYINILSPVINAFVLWTTPPIMIIGMAAG